MEAETEIKAGKMFLSESVIDLLVIPGLERKQTVLYRKKYMTVLKIFFLKFPKKYILNQGGHNQKGRPCNITCFPQPHAPTQSFTAAPLQHISGAGGAAGDSGDLGVNNEFCHFIPTWARKL